MRLKPLHDWVVIEREPDKVEGNGFFISISPSNKGDVLAVGAYVQGIEVGDRVQINAYAGLVIRTVEMIVTTV